MCASWACALHCQVLGTLGGMRLGVASWPHFPDVISIMSIIAQGPVNLATEQQSQNPVHAAATHN
jgi:hypothetical protein